MKIKRIQINNYRAFLVNGDDESKRYIIDLANGENLLLYGENGSGKSSLFKALKDFFISALNTGIGFQKNLFYDEGQNSEQPFISITLEDDSEHLFSAEMAKTNTYLSTAIKEANITKGFISYRDLLKLHFRQGNKEPDLFSFFLGEEGLFTDMIVPTPQQSANRIPFGELWKKIKDKPGDDALSDYNTNIAGQFQELENRANLLLKYFQKECNLKINYSDGAITEGIVIEPKVYFKVTLFGKEITEHDEVLNEARLTALAISIYLAHILSLPPTGLRILFLDDIFIGLDMSNRIPLIEILTTSDLGDGSSFQDFQIFLTTYDREWFHIAKTYLEAGWQKAEFYVDNHSCPVERPLIRRSGTYKERAAFHFIHGDYPACANYLRKSLEQVLRNIIPENKLYKEQNSADIEDCQVSVSKRQLSMKETDHSWLFFQKESAGISGSLPRPATLHNLIDIFKSLMKDYDIPFPYSEELTKIKNRLLNPLSHDDLRSSIFKKELETGFTILEELNKVKSKILVGIFGDNPAYLFFDKEDANGNDYKYKFQLLENLRYLEYNGTGQLINAECKPISRTLKSNDTEEPGEGKNQRSLHDLCKGICIFSATKGNKENIVLEVSTLLNKVYTENGQFLNNLI